jgi:hypothetical protein
LALEADAHRPRRDRRTALMLFDAIKKEGFNGGHTIVTDFIRTWRNHAVTTGTKSAYVPLKFELGEAFQFDWSEEWLVIGGIHRKILAAHTKLCASRAFLAYRLSHTKSRDVVRCTHPSFYGFGRRSSARHLRQHEDCRR